jgi:DNA-binding transcriptional LysR family regulator
MNNTARRAPVSLRAIDLNLLVVLDALIAERQVTRAAHRLALSQPAVSNALSRLRAIFADELLVRTARGMQPTPRALELAAPLQQLLRQTERIFEKEADFTPQSAAREFSVRMSDLIAWLALPRMAARLRAEAPGVRLKIMHLSPEQTVDALETDDADLALSMRLDHPRSIRAEPLFRDRMVCVMRRDHPATQRRLTLKAFLGLPHLRVSMSPTDARFVDNALARLGLERKVALNVPHWLTVPAIVAATDLVAVISEKVARSFDSATLALLPLPFAAQSFDWSLYWHRRHDGNAAHRWLRNVTRETCGGI